MGSITAKFNINLKTGFFKTEEYVLLLRDDSMILSPVQTENKGIIEICYSEIEAVHINGEDKVNFEIKKATEIFIGAFPRIEDRNSIIKAFKNAIGNKLLLL